MEVIIDLFKTAFQILIVWWWVSLPLFLYKPFLYLWREWRKDQYSKKIKWVLLEIKLPEEILKPIKAMEAVMSGLWQLYDPPNWKEKWFEGKKLLYYSLEMVGKDGVLHFYVRTPNAARNLVESSIYGQYPEVQITEVEDYTKDIPKNIPNKDWDVHGVDMMLVRDDVYPLKGYKEFETEREAKEVKRVDPIASLTESVAKLRKGEQLWVQFVIKPLTTEENNWVERGNKIVKQVMGKEPPSLEPFPQYAARGTGRVLILGEPLEEAEKEPERLEVGALKLSPGEIEIVKGIQNKIGKYCFESNIRILYLGKRDVLFKPNISLGFAFFNEFNTFNLNTIKLWGKTKTKIQLFLIDRRLYLRKRKLFRNYMRRNTPLDPREGGTYVLSTEELASMFHFPSREVAPAPSVPRIPAKRGEAPPELPTE